MPKKAVKTAGTTPPSGVSRLQLKKTGRGITLEEYHHARSLLCRLDRLRKSVESITMDTNGAVCVPELVQEYADQIVRSLERLSADWKLQDILELAPYLYKVRMFRAFNDE